MDAFLRVRALYTTDDKMGVNPKVLTERAEAQQNINFLFKGIIISLTVERSSYRSKDLEVVDNDLVLPIQTTSKKKFLLLFVVKHRKMWTNVQSYSKTFPCQNFIFSLGQLQLVQCFASV